MDNNELLEKFYNEDFKNRYDPAFSELSEEYKKSISNLTRYKMYCAGILLTGIFNKFLNKIGLKQ